MSSFFKDDDLETIETAGRSAKDIVLDIKRAIDADKPVFIERVLPFFSKFKIGKKYVKKDKWNDDKPTYFIQVYFNDTNKKEFSVIFMLLSILIGKLASNKYGKIIYASDNDHLTYDLDKIHFETNDKLTGEKAIAIQTKYGKIKHIPESKFIVQDVFNVKLKPFETITHLDGDVRNNDINNIRICNQATNKVLYFLDKVTDKYGTKDQQFIDNMKQQLLINYTWSIFGLGYTGLVNQYGNTPYDLKPNDEYAPVQGQGLTPFDIK